MLLARQILYDKKNNYSIFYYWLLKSKWMTLKYYIKYLKVYNYNKYFIYLKFL